jgi:hypothetical protein
MTFSQRSHEGYLFVDHRASPGIPEEKAIQMGLPPSSVKEGQVYEAPTLGCIHCGCHVVLNPNRVRARAFCSKCNRYICDYCEAARQQPDYIHRTIHETVDIITRSNSIG